MFTAERQLIVVGERMIINYRSTTNDN